MDVLYSSAAQSVGPEIEMSLTVVNIKFPPIELCTNRLIYP